MRSFISILIGIFFVTTMNAQQTPKHKVLKVDFYEQAIQKKEVQLVDVRTEKEYKEGHIEGADNIDFFAEDFIQQFSAYDKDEPLYIYCRSGNRSAKATLKLSEAGFKQVIDLEGGYMAWQKAGKQ